MRKFASFSIGAVLGGLVGTTLALLFAPESGTELRSQIRERTNAFAAEVQKAIVTKRIELHDRLETMRLPKAE
jgi:gas vesicle protein